MTPILRNILLAAGFVACALGAAFCVAALPEVMRGGIFPLHTSEELLFEVLNGDFK